MNLSIKKKRRARRTFGLNYKWTKDANLIAFHTFIQKLNKQEKESIAYTLGCSLGRLDNRIQHFHSLSEESKARKALPSKTVIEIYKEHKDISKDKSSIELENLLANFEKPQEEISTNIYNEEDEHFKEYEASEISNIDETFKNYWLLQKELQILDMNSLEWKEFIKVVSTMNIKSRGIKIEKRFIAKNELKKSVMKEQGDAWLANGEGVEIKTSFITPLKGSSVSLTGLRLWEEKVLHYLFIIIDISDLEVDPKSYIFWVPKSKLVELEQLGKLATPGMKKSAAMDNKNVAKSLTIKKDELDNWAKEFSLPATFCI